jgi:hypothetical protein
MLDGSPDRFTLVLAVWGAALSTLLAVFQLAEFRYKILRQLQIDAVGSHMGQELVVVVENAGQRPVTIMAVDLRYGPEPRSSTVILRRLDSLPRKLDEGDVIELRISRAEIMEHRASEALVQRGASRLWVGIHIPRRGINYRFVQVDEAFVPDPSYKPINDYIAADVFIGFPPQEYKTRSARYMK